MWVCIFASFLCLHSAGRGAILFKCRADGGRGELGFSAGVLWPLSTWCCSTNKAIYRDLELVPRVMLESAFSKASMVLKFLFKTAGTGKGVVAHSSLAEGLTCAISNRKTIWNMQWILNYRCPKPAETNEPVSLIILCHQIRMVSDSQEKVLNKYWLNFKDIRKVSRFSVFLLLFVIDLLVNIAGGLNWTF